MRKIKLIRGKRKGMTIPRRLIRKAVLEAYGIDPSSLKKQKKQSSGKKKTNVSKLASKKKAK